MERIIKKYFAKIPGSKKIILRCSMVFKKMLLSNKSPFCVPSWAMLIPGATFCHCLMSFENEQYDEEKKYRENNNNFNFIMYSEINFGTRSKKLS